MHDPPNHIPDLQSLFDIKLGLKKKNNVAVPGKKGGICFEFFLKKLVKIH